MSQSNLNGKAVLIVDDNVINQLIAQEMLINLGISSLLAADGKQALECLQDQLVDLVLMDIEMPVMNGLVASKQIRHLGGEYQHLPIVAMTANDSQQGRDNAIGAGMNDYLVKPLEVDQLSRVVSQYLSFDFAKNSDGDLNANVSGVNPFSQLKGFDYFDALNRLRGKEDLLRNMLYRFISDNHAADQRLHDLIASKQYREAERLAHTIKGSGANLGLVELSAVASKIEKELKLGSERLPNKLLETFSDVITYLNNHLALFEDKLTIDDSLDKKIVDRTEIESYLKEIKNNIQVDLGKVQDSVQALVNASKGTEYAEFASDICGAFEQFNLSKIKQEIENFHTKKIL